MFRTLHLERLSAFRLPDEWSRWIVAFLLAALAVQTAGLVWALVTPVGPVGSWRPAVPAAISAERRAAIFASVDPFAGTSGATAMPSLPNDLKLFGVRAAMGALEGGAIIALPDGQQVSVSIGETVMPGVELAAVGFDYADVVRNGARQRLFLDQDKPPETVGASSAGVAPVPTPAPTGAITGAALRAAVRLSPRTSQGGISGVVVGPGANPAGFARTGLRDGDVVVAVNGAKIASAEDLAQLQQSLATPGTLSLQVERGGSVVPVSISIASPQ